MVTIISCMGIIGLFYIQFRLYKAEELRGVKEFFKSRQLWEEVKEFLVIILGVTLAINFTNAVENKQTQEKVMKMLDTLTGEISAQIIMNEYFVNEYNEDKINDAELRNNAKCSTALIENILNNDTVIVTASPVMYGMMINNVDLINEFWSTVDNAQGEDLVIAIKGINNHFRNILWAIQSETEYLQGKSTQSDLKKAYNEYMRSVYTIIDNVA